LDLLKVVKEWSGMELLCPDGRKVDTEKHNITSQTVLTQRRKEEVKKDAV
jgi:hypothetical protein